ncbi:MAG: hypothetical protein HRT38_14850 [Alteromonadaceae bacterium]|nr:hypothetical protein [Alteromonadaceae bacterium]
MELLPGCPDRSPQERLTVLFDQTTLSDLIAVWDHLPPSKCSICSHKTTHIDGVGMMCTTCGFIVDYHIKNIINYVRKRAGFSLTEMSKLTGYGVDDIKRFEKGEVPNSYYQAFKHAIKRHYKTY